MIKHVNREEVEGRGPGGTAGVPPTDVQVVPPELDEFFREGGSSNTPSPNTIGGGEDWFEIGLFLNHPDFDSLAERLDAAKDAAMYEREGNRMVLGDVTFLMRDRSASLGDSKKGSIMRWVLVGENGFTMMLMNSPRSNGMQPNGLIRVTSIPLMQNTAETLWADMQYIVDGLGAELEKTTLSHVDPCVDLAGVDIEEFMIPYRNDWIVTRACQSRDFRNGIMEGGFRYKSKATGFQVGGPTKRVRVYEKRIEVKHSPAKLALLMANRWGYLPEKAVRVEFQLRRQALKALGVGSADDWFKKRAKVCEYLTEKWFRLMDGVVDRKHPDRRNIHSARQKTIDAFRMWTGTASSNIELTPLPKLQVDNSRLIKTANGLFVNYMANIGMLIRDEEQFLRRVVFELQQVLKDRDISKEVDDKRIELGRG